MSALQKSLESSKEPWTTAVKNGRVIVSGDKKIGKADKDVSDPTAAWANARLMAASREAIRLLIEVVDDGLKTNTKDWQQRANELIRQVTE